MTYVAILKERWQRGEISFNAAVDWLISNSEGMSLNKATALLLETQVGLA